MLRCPYQVATKPSTTLGPWAHHPASPSHQVAHHSRVAIATKRDLRSWWVPVSPDKRVLSSGGIDGAGVIHGDTVASEILPILLTSWYGDLDIPGGWDRDFWTINSMISVQVARSFNESDWTGSPILELPGVLYFLLLSLAVAVAHEIFQTFKNHLDLSPWPVTATRMITSFWDRSLWTYMNATIASWGVDPKYDITPLKINMEHNSLEVWKIIFLSKWVIWRFQPLIFQGVMNAKDRGSLRMNFWRTVFFFVNLVATKSSPNPCMKNWGWNTHVKPGYQAGDWARNTRVCLWGRTNEYEDTLPETNIAMENPPCWWYLPGKMVIFMGYVSFREDIHLLWYVFVGPDVR